MDIAGGVAGNKIRLDNEIRAADGGFTKPQVALGQAAGFFGVINEIGLAVQIGIISNNFNGVLVGPYSPVTAHAPQFCTGLAGWSCFNFFADGQTGVGDIVVDPDGEIIFGGILLQVFVDGQDLTRRGILGA